MLEGTIARSVLSSTSSDFQHTRTDLTERRTGGQAFAYGLPGSLDPVKNFDPFGFADGASLEEMKMYREAEVTHGRVSMLAVLGFIVQEKVHFAFVDPAKDIGPAIRHLDEVRAVNPWFFEVLTFAIALAEARRSTVGWKSPFKPGA